MLREIRFWIEGLLGGLLFAFLFLANVSCCTADHWRLDGGKLGNEKIDYYWDKEDFPLTVLASVTSPPKFKVALEGAIHTWNTEVEGKVFEIKYIDLYDSDVGRHYKSGVVGFSVKDLPRNLLGWATNYEVHKEDENRLFSVQVFIDDREYFQDSSYDMRRVIAHEMGHVLLLAHDVNDPRSMMYTPYNSDLDYYIMPDDAERVRRMME